MANIAALPDAQTMLRAGKPIEGKTFDYGPHLHSVLIVNTLSLLDAGDRVLAWVSNVPADYNVSLRAPGLTAQTVPYVNKFIAHTGLKVERYWRTKEYRLVPVPGTAPVSLRAPKVAAIKPEPVETFDLEPELEPDVEVEVEVEVPAVTITVPHRAEHLGDETIPGLAVPPKVKVTNGGKGYTRVGDIVVPDADYRTLTDAWKLRAAGNPAGVLITGPAGTAKTALAQAFAASMGIPFLKVDGGSIRTADDWAGAFRQDPNTKTWAHRWSPFAQVLRAGRPALVLIDEVNRTESPQALNALLGLMDWTGSLSVPDANASLVLPPGILVVATANIGPEYVGTLPIDGAVRQRFPYGVRLDYPTENVEAALVAHLTGVSKPIGERLVKMAAQQRLNREDPQQYPSGSVISTRVLLDIARRIADCKADPREAVLATLRGQFDPGDEAALSVCVDVQFPAPKAPDAVTEVQPDAATIVVGRHYFADDGAGLCRYVIPGMLSGVPCMKVHTDPIHY